MQDRWCIRIKKLSGDRIIWAAIDEGSSPVSYLEVIDLWSQNVGFREFFIRVLADVPYSAFRWETPPVTRSNINRPFEFVILDSPGLVSTPDKTSFAEHFNTAPPGSVIEFTNLGGDAVLIVPCPDDSTTDYSHLAAFLRNAPESVQHELWKTVAEAMESRLGKKPVWLSTAGGGVAWLHVRLDSYPKYYGYQPYRQTAGHQEQF